MYARFKLMPVLCALMGLSLQASAEEGSYIKVEIKGRFVAKTGGLGGHGNPIVKAADHDVEVLFEPKTRPKDREESLKQLEELKKEAEKLDGKLVLIQGRMVLLQNRILSNRLGVMVDKVTVVPEKNK